MRISALIRSVLGDEEEAGSDKSGSERRVLPRHDLIGEEVGLLIDSVRYRLHVRDISRTGLSGVTDAPLAPGQRLYLMFSVGDGHLAEICWIRNARVGAHFITPLTSQELTRVRAAHRLKRRRKAGSFKR
jgi:hypothetical protein